jgi:hypothetical protein
VTVPYETPGQTRSSPANGPRYRRTRDVAGGCLVALATLIAGLSLIAYLASVTLLRAESTLSSNDLSKFTQNIGSQIAQASPGFTSDPLGPGAIQKALQNPSIVQGLSQSTSQGSQSLNQQLTQLDPSLGPTLQKNPIQLDIGNGLLANLQHSLQTAPIWGALLAAALVLIALAVSLRRDQVLRRVGRWAIAVSLFAVLVGWVLPWFLASHVNGLVGSLASWYSNDQSVAHTVYLALFAFGVAAYAAGSLLKPRALNN